jgi:hypothetical protein
VKKLAIVLLLVVAACQKRPVVVTTAPNVNDPGAASAREAVTKFMGAAKAQDLQAFATVWGTTAGPARSTIPADELEKRMIVLMCHLKHDSFRILNEAPAENQERVFTVESKYRDLTRTANFFAVAGPANRWYVRTFESAKFQEFCQRR